VKDCSLQDRISRGLGAAARAIGGTTEAYRPSCMRDPLDQTNRFLRLQAAFSAPDGRFLHPNGYGSALWYGVFDSAYTRAGDYLVQQGATWFIAAQQPLLPPLCVKATRVVSFMRPVAPSAVGPNGYAGVNEAELCPLLTRWPASVLGASGSGRPESDLPADTSVPYWTTLLPAFSEVVLRPSDLMRDDWGRTAVVSAAELTELGRRLTLKQAIT
jgi:hypothetical protein